MLPLCYKWSPMWGGLVTKSEGVRFIPSREWSARDLGTRSTLAGGECSRVDLISASVCYANSDSTAFHLLAKWDVPIGRIGRASASSAGACGFESRRRHPCYPSVTVVCNYGLSNSHLKTLDMICVCWERGIFRQSGVGCLQLRAF